MNVDDLSGPQGLKWFWKIVFGRGFVRGFLVVFGMTPVLMTVLGFLWSGRVPSWDEQYKSFIIGDSLLALAVGVLAAINRRPAQTEHKVSKRFWLWWLAAGFVSSAGFIAHEVIAGMIKHWWTLLEPHIFYHHVILFVTMVPLLCGTGYTLFRRRPHDFLWVVAGLLVAGYVGLVAFDNLRPPKPTLPSKPHSAEFWFNRTIDS